MAIHFRDLLDDLQDTADRYAERSGQSAWVVKLTEPGWTALLTYRMTKILYDASFRAAALLIAVSRNWRCAPACDPRPSTPLPKPCSSTILASAEWPVCAR